MIEHFISVMPFKVEFSGTVLMLFLASMVLSLMIGFQIMSYGMFNVIIYFIISYGMGIILPEIKKLINDSVGKIKACYSTEHVYGMAALRLAFYMLFRNIGSGPIPPAATTVYLYMFLYFAAYAATDLGISFMFC